jgi:hypothetical protein
MVLAAIIGPLQLLSIRPLPPTPIPASIAPKPHEGVIFERSLQGGVRGAYQVQQNPERKANRVRERDSEKPHHTARGAPLIYVPQPGKDAQHRGEHRVEPRIEREKMTAPQWRATVLAELRPGNYDRLAASPTIVGSLEIRFRHGR